MTAHQSELQCCQICARNELGNRRGVGLIPWGWCAIMEGTDVCFAPVLSLGEAPRHAHIVARGTFIEVEGVTQPAPAPRFSRSRPDKPTTARAAGSDTTAVLLEAGYSEARIDELRALGILT